VATKEVDPVSESKTETTIDRATLYELVWSKPTAYLARDYGLSDVALGKICRAMNVPKPPRGYWAKVRRGQRIERPPLPPDSDPSTASVTIQATIKKERPKAVAIETPPLARPVALHTLVIRTQAALGREKPSQEGLYSANGSGMLAIVAGESSRLRALHFMDALLKVLEQRDHKVESDTSLQSGRGTVVTLKNGERLSMRLRERLNRVSHVMTKDERRRFERDGWEPYTKYDFHPSGELHLEVGKAGYSWVSKTWRDGKRRKLEQVLGEIVGGLEALAESNRLDRLRRAEEERVRAEEARRREEERRLREEEAKRFAQLRLDSKHWHECRELREYLSAVEQEMSGRQTPEFNEWLGWARQKVDELDPLFSVQLRSME
jgi:hypothetical protein